MNIIGSLFKDIKDVLWLYTAPSVIFAVLVMFLIMQLGDKSLMALIRRWIRKFKKSKLFRIQFIFFVYAYMMLSKTVLARKASWKQPFSKIMEGWVIEKTDKGLYSYESIENFIMFIPYLFLFFMAFFDRSIKYKNKDMLLRGAAIAFCSSLFIEIVQAVFRIGTFQISDLLYNTLGGITGTLIFILYLRFRERYN